MTTLLLDGVSISYGATRALGGLTLAVNDDELVALLGPSGCGKTTALKVIAGLLKPDEGDVRFSGDSVLATPAERRNAAMVFQKPLLFPHLTVAENIAFGLKMRRLSKDETARRIAQALQWVRLEGYERRKPDELSGGQEQRVALARALITEPRVLLLDEPFSALDENLRGEMRLLVRELQRRLRITTVFVTHDRREALAVADRIALLLDGRIEQYSAPQELLLDPHTARAARFFGWKLLTGARRGQTLSTAAGDLNLPQAVAAERLYLAFRPENARIQWLDRGQCLNGCLKGRLESLLDYGARWQWRVRLFEGEKPDGEVIEGGQDHAAGESAPQIDDEVKLCVPENAWKFFELSE